MWRYPSKSAKSNISKSISGIVSLFLLAPICSAEGLGDTFQKMAKHTTEEFSKNLYNWLWLVLLISFCYGVGWIVHYFLIHRDEKPSDAGCIGCFTGLCLMMLFVITVFFALIIPNWLFWLVLVLCLVIAFIIVFTRGVRNLVGLIVLFLLIFLLSGLTHYWLGRATKTEEQSDGAFNSRRFNRYA